MKYTINSLASLLLILLLSSFSSPPTSTIASKWEKLGSRSVDFKIDRDVIQIGAKEGKFSKLKLNVTGGSLNMQKMKIEYYSGQIEVVNLKHKFTRKSSSTTIDIDGRKRRIKNIVFWYATSNRSKRKAKVTVFGK